MSRNLIFIAISLFTWGLGESAFFAFQPLYLQHLGANPIQIGAILGAVGLVAGAAHIPAGAMADRIGRRPLMISAWIIGTAATWMLALAQSMPLFVIGLLVYGMTGYVSAPMSSYVTVARGNWTVGRALTLTGAAYHSGAILGPVIGGMIGQLLGYRQIFLFGAIVFILSTIVIFLISAQPVEKQETGGRSSDLLKNRRFMAFLPVLFLAVFSMYLPQPLSANFLQNERNLSLLQIGQLNSVASLGIVLMSLIMGRMEARTGYLLGQSVVILFALILWRGTGMVWFGAGFFLMGGFRAARALATAHIRSLVSSSSMGLAFGLAETTSAMALVLAPALAGLLYDQNPEWMYLAAALLISISVVVSFVASAPPRLAKVGEEVTV
jgi:MFS family permease